MVTSDKPLAQYLAAKWIGPGKPYANPNEFAEKTGFQYSQVRSFLTTGGASQANLRRLSEALGVPIVTLYVKAGWLEADEVPGERLEDDERRLLDQYRTLDADQQTAVLRIVELMPAPASR